MADADLSIMDLAKLKVPDLKKELKSRGLNTSGNKIDLMERLQTALKSKDTIGTESVDDLEEDLLNDDSDEPLESNESVIITDIDTALDDSLVPKAPKRKSNLQVLEEEETKEDKSEPIAKKVILNRNTPIIAPDKRISTDSKEGSDKTSSLSSSEEKKGVVKLSEITAKERLDMRAKKFDVTITPDARKIARAERFGKQLSNTPTDSTKIAVNSSLDVLKQRAARFGQSVSPAMSKLEVQEKLEKRKARFGVVVASVNNKSSVHELADLKAKQRLERFKQPVK